MNTTRWGVVMLATMLIGLGFPWVERWERGCLSIAVILMCILVLVGPAKERR